MTGGHTFTPLPTWSGSLGEPRALPPIEWDATGLPPVDTVLVVSEHGTQRSYTAQRGGHWPFPPMDPMQERRHHECVESLRKLEQRRRQQRLQECIEAFGEALL